MKKTIYALLFLMSLWIVPSFATDTITSMVVEMPLRSSTQTFYVAPGEKVRVAVTGGLPPFSWVANTGHIENIDTDNANENYYTAPKIMGEDLIKIYDAKNNTTEVKVYVTKLFNVTPNVRYMNRGETKTFRVVNGVSPYTAVVLDADGNLSPETPSEDGKFSYTAGNVADKDIIIEFSDNSGQTVQAHAYVELKNGN